jgi:signal peptidase
MGCVKIIKKVLKTIVDILTILVFIVLVFIIISKVKMMVKGEDYFEFFGYSLFNVATGSMEPVINQNDIIVVKRQSKYEVDDIITFKGEGAYITHRVVAVNGDNFVTKGDANNAKDVAITKDKIIGKVIKISSKAGIWHKVLTTPTILILIFTTLILFDFAFSYKGIKEKKNKKIVEKIQNVPLEEVNKEKDSPDMSQEEIKELYNKTDKVIKGEQVEFDKKEQDFLNYTVRLDLDELMKRINNNVSGDKNAK